SLFPYSVLCRSDGVYIALKRHKTDTSNERSIRIQKTFCASNCWQGKCCQRDRITAYQIALYTAREDGNPCSFRHHSNSEEILANMDTLRRSEDETAVSQ